MISTQLLAPLLPVLQLLVAAASASAAEGVAAHDMLLHTLSKCLHHTVRRTRHAMGWRSSGGLGERGWCVRGSRTCIGSSRAVHTGVKS